MRLVVVVVAIALLLTGCGVTTEDSPQIIEDTTSEAPEATPSIDTETSPPPTSTTTSTTTSAPTSSPAR